MALADIHVKKPREAQIWNCCTGNPVLRILPDSNISFYPCPQRRSPIFASFSTCRMFTFSPRMRFVERKIAHSENFSHLCSFEGGSFFGDLLPYKPISETNNNLPIGWCCNPRRSFQPFGFDASSALLMAHGKRWAE